MARQDIADELAQAERKCAFLKLLRWALTQRKNDKDVVVGLDDLKMLCEQANAAGHLLGLPANSMPQIDHHLSVECWLVLVDEGLAEMISRIEQAIVKGRSYLAMT